MSDMPREEVERLMRESGMSFHLGMPHKAVVKQMIRFASMLRDEILEASEHAIQCAMEFEREACAQVCIRSPYPDGADLAERIRARGEK